MANILYQVPHIHQKPGSMDCWAAATAMVLGQSVGPGQGAISPGRNIHLGGGLYARTPCGGLTLTDENIGAFALSHGLKLLPQQAQTNTIEGIATMLHNGPLIVGGKYAHGSPHATVIAGVRGCNIYVLDPAANGKKGWVDYNALMTRFPYATAILMQKDGPPPPQCSTPSMLLRRGSRGTDVIHLQRRLGIQPNGIFGPRTAAAVRDLQHRNGSCRRRHRRPTDPGPSPQPPENGCPAAALAATSISA